MFSSGRIDLTHLRLGRLGERRDSGEFGFHGRFELNRTSIGANALGPLRAGCQELCIYCDKTVPPHSTGTGAPHPTPGAAHQYVT